MLDADIRGFFDSVDHEWLVKFVEHRIGDRRVVRLIQKWLKAGVLEDGTRTTSETGTVQGGSISPLLANLYLHYVFDLWVQRWRTTRANGDVIVVRYADDFIVGFKRREDAERFLTELRERFAKFGLELHPEKTRLVPFGPIIHRNWRAGWGYKSGTFDFLGFTHITATGRHGKCVLLRKTARGRWHAKLREVRTELRRRMHAPIPEQGKYLRSVLTGYFRYYGVPGNLPSISTFRNHVARIWRWTLRRRSQRHRMPWQRFERYAKHWLPRARVCHPWPRSRFGVTTRGKSRMR